MSNLSGISSGFRTCLSAFLLLSLSACLTDSTNSTNTGGAVIPAATPVANYKTGTQLLQIPFVQSGGNWYADVQLKLAADGSYSVLNSRQLSAPATASDATLSPAIDPASLATSNQPVTLSFPRLHIDAKVYDNAAVVFDGGKWKYRAGLTEATALSRKDFAANADLVASSRHIVALASVPETRTQMIPMQLETRAYRLCADQQDDGADEIALLDNQGVVLASVMAGAPCVPFFAAAGKYTLRHTYGGTGSRRTVFLRQRDTPLPNSGAARAARGALMRAQALSDASHPEYWALAAVADIPETPFLSFIPGGQDTSAGYPSYPPPYPPTSANCYGTFDLAGKMGFWDRAMDLVFATPPYRRTLDGNNLFHAIRDASGNVTAIGMSYYCDSNTSSFYNGATAAGYFPSSPYQSTWPLLASTNEYGATIVNLTPEFTDSTGRYMKLILPPYTSAYVGVPTGYGDGLQAAISGQGNYFPGLNWGPSSASLTFQLAFRFFPKGLASYDLDVGQVALFTTQDCSGRALVVDNFDMPTFALLDFSGSMFLGPQTNATVYDPASTTAYTGKSKLLIQSGCIKQDFQQSAGFSRIGFSSMQITTNTRDIVLQHMACEDCNLTGIDLSSLPLKGVKFARSNLTGARLLSSDLSNSDLRYAILQGARLNNANLDSANLCQASLNAANQGSSAAILTGAHLKNANLDGANLDGATFSSASFYSSDVQSLCQPGSCATYALPKCASANGASMNNTGFSNAYLAGVDMSGATANGASFSRAVLFGAKFKKATLNQSSTGQASDFSYAFLEGTDFTNAQITNANFSSAYFDSDPSGKNIEILLPNEYTNFPGFTTPADPTDTTGTSCTAAQQTAGQQSIPACVKVTYGAAVLPTFGKTNTCPDGKSVGPCSSTALNNPATPIQNASLQTGTDAAPLCGTFTTPPPNPCW